MVSPVWTCLLKIVNLEMEQKYHNLRTKCTSYFSNFSVDQFQTNKHIQESSKVFDIFFKPTFLVTLFKICSILYSNVFSNS